MATIGYTSAPGNILGTGLSSWKVKYSGDVARYSLGDLTEGKISIKGLFETTSTGQERQHAVEVEASAKLYQLVPLLSLLPSLGPSISEHVLTGINGKTFKGPFGTRWRLVSDADFDKAMYIEFFADYRCLIDGTGYDLADILTAPGADGTPDAGDTLYTLSTLANNITVPSGLVKWEVRPRADSTWEDVGVIRNGKIYAELLSSKSSHGKSIGREIKVSASVDLMQTDAEMAFLKNTVALDHKITLATEAAWTFDNLLGAQWTIDNTGDMGTDIQHIKLAASGVMTAAQFAAAIA